MDEQQYSNTKKDVGDKHRPWDTQVDRDIDVANNRQTVGLTENQPQISRQTETQTETQIKKQTVTESTDTYYKCFGFLVLFPLSKITMQLL